MPVATIPAMLHLETRRRAVQQGLRTRVEHRLVQPRPVLRAATEKVQLMRMLGVNTTRQSARSRRALAPLGDSARSAVYRDLWRASAAALGGDYCELGAGYGEIRLGRVSTRVFHQVTVLDDAVTLRRALRHHDAQEEMRARGLSVAEAVAFTPQDPGPALDLIARTGPCVVKPAHGTAGGDGVTVGVGSDDLPLALLAAGRFSGGMIAERRLVGYLFRVLLLDQEVVDVIRDDVPHVVGDGESTIAGLMAAENARREAAFGRLGLSYWELDLDTALTLRRNGRRADDVVAPGLAVPVKSVTNDRRVEDSQTYRHKLHPSVLDEARVAADIVGLRLAGVDLVAPRVDRPFAETGGALLEVNGAPGIHRHYQVSEPAAATDVGAVILRRLLD